MSRNGAQDLLIRLLRSSQGQPGTSEQREIPTADWERMIELAIRTGVAPLIYHYVRTLPDLDIPSGAITALRELYNMNALRNLRIYRQLHSILQALHDAGIAVAILKGAYLAQFAYDNIAHRSMADIDILVRQADVTAAERCLRDLGYRVDEGKPDDIQTHSQVAYRAPDEDVGVEIHWDIRPAIGAFRVDMDGVWQRMQPITIAGTEALALQREDLLLHLCLHASSHHLFKFYGLRSLCDIAAVVRRCRDPIDWEALQARAHQWEGANGVYLTLRLARDLLQAHIPSQVLEGLISEDFDERYILWAQQRIFLAVDDASGPWSDNLGQFWGSRRIPSKVLALLQGLFPPRQRLAQMYSVPPESRRIYLYYPVRLIGLLLRLPYTLWRLRRRDVEEVAWMEREAGRIALMKWLIPARE